MSDGFSLWQGVIYPLVIQPFADFGFMRRALVACCVLALSVGPVGVLLVLRRMSLLGDAVAHAMLPGAAMGFFGAGLSIWAMSAGGFIAAMVVALGAGLLTRWTSQKEDASFAALYLVALSLGVLMISVRGTSVDLTHILFGNILAVDDDALLLIGCVSSVTLVALALFYRPLLISCVDPAFLAAQGQPLARTHHIFLTLMVINMVAAFQALGTLMAVGLMMLPALAARFWVNDVPRLWLLSSSLAMLCGASGLLLSYHFELPSGPAIVLVAGGVYALSLGLGQRDSLRVRLSRTRHLKV
ncbi:metal ABC transporter permease [Amphibiibacter pelophylacis]|uniref:Metal ABC transporter permease n=1 Tax=Amphibiibacter pelophylacis TaxID=1799477 RepID=A0ACC6P1N4_9BURK